MIRVSKIYTLYNTAKSKYISRYTCFYVSCICAFEKKSVSLHLVLWKTTHVKHLRKIYLHTILLVTALLSMQTLVADDDVYLCELGAQAGVGYYIGDGADHIFNHPRYAAGVQFRYKFDQRWALQVKGQTQRIAFVESNEDGSRKEQLGYNDLWNIDVVGEFNFFRFGAKQYDERVRSYTPYIFLGVGIESSTPAPYIPFGIGFKWKFAKWCGLNIAWQQNLYLFDNLEGYDYYDNPNKLNGSNILKNDFTSSLTIGIVFEFGKPSKVCRTCDQ